MFASGGYGFGRKKRSVDVEETSAAAARPACEAHSDCSPPWEDCFNAKCWRHEEVSYLTQTFGKNAEDWLDANLPIEITQQNKGRYIQEKCHPLYAKNVK